MIPFKYRLVTDEAKCGSMGRTRHLLRVHSMARKSVAGVVRIPWPTQGCRGPCTCTLLAPVNWSLPLSILRLCALAVRLSSRDGSTPESFLCSGCQGTPHVLSGAGLQLWRALPCPQYNSSYIEVLKPCCVGKKPSCARGVSLTTPLRPALGWAVWSQ